jgi:hypothetical protein
MADLVVAAQEEAASLYQRGLEARGRLGRGLQADQAEPVEHLLAAVVVQEQ